MRRTTQVSKDFMEAMDKFKDCPEELFKMAKSDFEKATAIEFFELHKECAILKDHMKMLETMIAAVFGVGVIGLLIQIIPKFFGV